MPPEKCKVCEKECWGSACSVACAKVFLEDTEHNMNQKYGSKTKSNYSNSITGGDRQD